MNDKQFIKHMLSDNINYSKKIKYALLCNNCFSKYKVKHGK